MATSSTLRAVRKSAGVAAPLATVAVIRNSFLSLTAAAQQLAQLNLQYIALLATDGGLADTFTSHLRGMSDDALLAMADCPFSLFKLGFEDSRRWLQLLNEAPAMLTSLPDDPHLTDAHTEFVATVVFFAWHLSHSDPLAAKVLLEVEADVAVALRGISIARLRAVATSAADWLKPRWRQNRIFWPALVRHAGHPAGIGLRATKLLGRQLLAAESLAILPAVRSNRRTFAAYRVAARGSFGVVAAT